MARSSACRVVIALALGLAAADAFLPTPTLRGVLPRAHRGPLCPRPDGRARTGPAAASMQDTSVRSAERGGGRAPTKPDTRTASGDPHLPPPTPAQARLTVIQVTDVYTLENFPHLRTLIAEKKKENPNTVSVLTGDFLAPYLLSSIEKGYGMMRMIDATPIDYLTWGNHEADIEHETVCKHVRGYKGKWINTNMPDHEAMDHQTRYDVIEVPSADGTHTRRVGLVAVLSNEPGLYANAAAPGAFGGATIEDPWETLRVYKQKLEDEEKCDLVIPLQHTYVPDDHKTCREFDFPVMMSGHDHHRVDEVVEGTRLLKPGLDAIYATCLDITWDGPDKSAAPHVTSRFLRVDEWDADKELEAECDRAYQALAPLRNTELARVPPRFRPLSSFGARGRVCTMGTYICSLLRSALNTDRNRATNCDVVLMMGGNIRGGADYPDKPGYFSLEALEAEIRPDETIGVVTMPGWLISEGVRETHRGAPKPGWFQYDDGVREDVDADAITHINYEPLDPEKMYQVGTKVGDLTNGQSPTMKKYFTEHPEALPPNGAYANVHSALMSFFARNLFRRMWDAAGPVDDTQDMENCRVPGEEGQNGEDLISRCDPNGRLAKLDFDVDGEVSVDDIHRALSEVLGLRVDATQKDLAQFVHSFADTDSDGHVTVEDFGRFCRDMPRLYKEDQWRLASPKDNARQPRWFKNVPEVPEAAEGS